MLDLVTGGSDPHLIGGMLMMYHYFYQKEIELLPVLDWA